METEGRDTTWIEKDLRPRFPVLAEKAERVYELFDQAMSGASLLSADFKWLEECCCERSSMLRDCAASIVGALSDKFTSAAELLLKLVETGRAEVAISAIAALHDLESHDLKTKIVRFGLKHRSKKVRELAADKAQRFRLYGVLAELEAAIIAEPDQEHRKLLEIPFSLLKDGHHVEHLEDGSVTITLAYPDWVTLQTYSKECVEEKGIQQLIENMKKFPEL